MPDGQLRLKFCHATQMNDRASDVALLHQQLTEGVLGIRILGIGLDGLLKRGARACRIPLLDCVEAAMVGSCRTIRAGLRDRKRDQSERQRQVSEQQVALERQGGQHSE